MSRNLHSYNIVAFDTETSNGKGSGSLNERDGFLALMQLKLPGEEPVILDPLAPNAQEVYDYVRGILADPDNIIVGHNLKFDYKWLSYNGLYIRNMFDTMIASQLYYTGIRAADHATQITARNKRAFKDNSDVEPMFGDYSEYLDIPVTQKSRFGHAFSACMLRELNIEISKAEQNSDWAKRPLSEDQITYALWDVKETDRLALVLWEKLCSVGLQDTFWLEMDVEPAIGFKEVTGSKVDRQEWATRSKQLNTEIKVEKSSLEGELGMRLALEQGDRNGLFGAVPVAVNLNSPHMAEWLDIPDTQASTLKEHEHKDPFITKFLKYKVKQKIASTYGTGYLKKIGSDNRLRGEFSQTFTDTGRLASKKPNLQNVPAKYIKSLLRPTDGNFLVAIDFSTVELRILAYLSGDKKFIDACNSKDMHSENARMLFGIPSDQPVPKDLRSKAKVVSFAVPYGTSAFGLFARGLTASVEEAQELIDKFYETYPKVAEFLKNNAHNASVHGITRDAIGRIRRYEIPTAPEDYDRKKQVFRAMRTMIYGKEWDFRDVVGRSFDSAVENYPGLETFCNIDAFYATKEVSRYETRLAGIRREGQNHPIQASSASITKRAMADVYNYLRDTGYGFLTLSIHDSIFYELKEKYFKYSFPDVVRIMEEAGPKIVPNIITPVDADFGWMVGYKCEAHQKEVHMFNQTLDGDVPRYLTDNEIKLEVEDTCAKEH